MIAMQRGVRTRPPASGFVALGGDGTTDVEGMVNETMVRGFYKCWRKHMGI
jgi:hypothetical protein